MALLRRVRLGPTVVAVVILVVLCGHMLTLLRYPPPFVDEAWAANRAWALLVKGIAFGDLDAGVFEKYPGYWTYFPMLPTSIQAAALWLAGHPALWPLRLVSLAFGAILLGACYLIGRSTGSRSVGFVSCTLTALSPAFLYSAHLARWDIMVAALGYSALAIQAWNARRSTAWAAFAGLLVGLAFEVHPHASLFVPVSAALYVAQSGWATLLRRDVWAWAAGIAAGASVYVALHLMRYPQGFLALMGLAHGPTHTPPLATADLRDHHTECHRHRAVSVLHQSVLVCGIHRRHDVVVAIGYGTFDASSAPVVAVCQLHRSCSQQTGVLCNIPHARHGPFHRRLCRGGEVAGQTRRPELIGG